MNSILSELDKVLAERKANPPIALMSPAFTIKGWTRFLKKLAKRQQKR